MTKTILALFDNKIHAGDVISDLSDHGFDAKEISIVMKDQEQQRGITDETGAGENMAKGAVGGATTGAVLGGIAGLVASIAIPGLGAFFIGGPLVTALGLTGVAASTVSGAATGAVAGGLLGGLMSLGLPEEEAKRYEKRINEGAILLAVPVISAHEENQVMRVFDEYGAADVQTVSARSKASDAREEVMVVDEDDVRFSSPDIDRSQTTTYGMKGGKSKSRKRAKSN